MPSRTPRRIVAAFLAAGLLATAACSDDKDDKAGTTPTEKLSGADELAAATTYADLVSATYADVITKTVALDAAIDEFVANPTNGGLEAAKAAWKDARVLYGPTEVFRFYEGPIDDEETGLEGQINAWPLDEAYIDYVQDDATAGIINDAAGVPTITTDVIVEANEKEGEDSISTGWHAIEFLLWGQDLSTTGPGERPVSDYSTSPVKERRATYLSLLSDLLVNDLTTVHDAWNAGAGSYRETFLSDPHEAVAHILRGMGALSKAELAGERIFTALDKRSQEDEHSCFSDNTNVDVNGNAQGIRMAYLADYTKLDGTKLEGTSLSSVVAKVDPTLDTALRAQLEATTTTTKGLLTGPTFDNLITDDAVGRTTLGDLVTALQTQGDEIGKLAGALGYSVSLTVA